MSNYIGNRKIIKICFFILIGILLSFLSILVYKNIQINITENNDVTPSEKSDRRIKKAASITSEKSLKRIDKSGGVSTAELKGESESAEIRKQLEAIRKSCEATEDLESAGFASLKPGYKLLTIDKVAIPQLLNEFTNSANDWKYRWLVAELLGEIGDTNIIKPMVSTLSDKNEMTEIRMAAANTLGKMKAHSAVDVLTTTLKSYEAKLRRASIRALGNIGEQRSALYLIQCLNDTDHLNRICAAKALGSIGDPKSTQALIDALKKDDSIQYNEGIEVPDDIYKNIVKMNIIAALGRLKDKKAVATIASFLKDPLASSNIKKSAATALGVIGTEKAKSALIIGLNDTDEGVQMYAATALATMQAKDTATKIAETITQIKDPYVRNNMEKALSKLTEK